MIHTSPCLFVGQRHVVNDDIPSITSWHRPSAYVTIYIYTGNIHTTSSRDPYITHVAIFIYMSLIEMSFPSPPFPRHEAGYSTVHSTAYYRSSISIIIIKESLLGFSMHENRTIKYNPPARTHPSFLPSSRFPLLSPSHIKVTPITHPTLLVPLLPRQQPPRLSRPLIPFPPFDQAVRIGKLQRHIRLEIGRLSGLSRGGDRIALGGPIDLSILFVTLEDEASSSSSSPTNTPRNKKSESEREGRQGEDGWVEKKKEKGKVG